MLGSMELLQGGRSKSWETAVRKRKMPKDVKSSLRPEGWSREVSNRELHLAVCKEKPASLGRADEQDSNGQSLLPFSLVYLVPLSSQYFKK